MMVMLGEVMLIDFVLGCVIIVVERVIVLSVDFFVFF